jgi:hypothetical protein
VPGQPLRFAGLGILKRNQYLLHRFLSLVLCLRIFPPSVVPLAAFLQCRCPESHASWKYDSLHRYIFSGYRRQPALDPVRNVILSWKGTAAKVLNQKWGTLSPIKHEDPKYGIPVAVKAFGNFSYRIVDPRGFFVNVVGGHNDFTAGDFRTIIAERLVQSITDHVAECRFSYTEIDSRREELVQGLAGRLTADFGKLGFAVDDFRIEGINFDDDTVRRIGRIADLTAEAQAVKAVGIDYTSMQKLEALREAARNRRGRSGPGDGTRSRDRNGPDAGAVDGTDGCGGAGGECRRRRGGETGAAQADARSVTDYGRGVCGQEETDSRLPLSDDRHGTLQQLFSHPSCRYLPVQLLRHPQ